MNNYLSSKQSKVLKNTFAYIDISQKKIIGIDSFDIGDIEKTTSLEDVEYTVLTNDPNIIKIKSSHENWGRGGKQNSKIILINKNQEIVKMFLFPCFKNSSIKVLFSFKGYLIIGSKNIYDVNDSTNWLYVYKISDLISTNCNNYLSESIDFDEKIPDTIMKKYDPNLIGDIEF
ncbi:hypothetical protein [uncultured Cytophaga sp.]|uniref:hypothetical protein n=1 Tax=uncultured Cytophaga sp. TaxID=160238 RepID=UPI0026357177|nr:hypothetical protein [uncultured Cytophaga sp.]